MAVATATYAYHALDQAGATRRGHMTAVSPAAVLEALSRQGMVPVQIDVATAAVTRGLLQRLQPPWRRPDQATNRDLVVLTESLAVLLKAGLAIDRALQINGAMSGKAALRRLSDSLLAAVRRGRTLSAAFAESQQKLPHFYVSMLQAGELGGALSQTLARIAELLRRQLEISERVKSALVYPAILATVVLATLIMLLTFVLPRFEVLFAGSEQALPWITLAVLHTGQFVSDYWWTLLAALLTSVGGVYAWLHSTLGRRRFDLWLLSTRIVFGLPKALDTARFLRTISTLSQNGATLPAALRIARGTLANSCLHAAMAGVIADVQSGAPLSRALARARVFPEIATQLARVGEESGQLEALLLSSASVLEQDTQVKLDRLLALLVPALTIGMGVIVAGLIGSVLIGLLSVNELAF